MAFSIKLLKKAISPLFSVLLTSSKKTISEQQGCIWAAPRRCVAELAGTLGRSPLPFSAHCVVGRSRWDTQRLLASWQLPSKSHRILKPFLFGKRAIHLPARTEREICRVGEGRRIWMMDASLLLNYPLFLAALPPASGHIARFPRFLARHIGTWLLLLRLSSFACGCTSFVPTTLV